MVDFFDIFEFGLYGKVVYEVSTSYYEWNWSKSFVWWVVVVVGDAVESTLLFIFGPNLKTLILTST